MSTYKMTCPGCGRKVEGDPALAGTDVVCPSCSRQFKAPTLLKPASAQGAEGAPSGGGDAVSTVKDLGHKFMHQVTQLAGEDRIEGFSFKQLFSEVFARHASQEVEEYFTVGTSRTTPDIAAVDPSWPHPWVFFRTFVGALIVYLVFLLAYNQYGNINLVPGLIIVGSFAVPLSMVILFVEINARKNVSLYQVVRLIFAGGVLGLVLSLILYSVTDTMKLYWLGDTIAGLVEEPGKLLAVLLVINSMWHRYILNGLLFGAAIGAGFAAFESAGYALHIGLQNTAAMTHNIMTRGMLSPFGHVAWTAMSAAALWKVLGPERFRFSMVKDLRFLRIFAIAIALHMIWDWSFDLPFYGKYLILGAVAWIIIIALIQDGLKQLREEKEAAASAPPGAI